jgi:uncharacterized membrane protein YphA (DoxX/SURF4 family)
MRESGSNTPSWVQVILEWRGTWLLARVALVSAYLIGGLTKLFDYAGAVAEQAHFGLQPPALWAVAAIAVELLGSLLIIWERLVWLAAGALAVLTLVATLVAENFWTLQGHARFVTMNSFFEHLGLVAAFAMVAMISAIRARNQFHYSVQENSCARS